MSQNRILIDKLHDCIHVSGSWKDKFACAAAKFTSDVSLESALERIKSKIINNDYTHVYGSHR